MVLLPQTKKIFTVFEMTDRKFFFLFFSLKWERTVDALTFPKPRIQCYILHEFECQAKIYTMTFIHNIATNLRMWYKPGLGCNFSGTKWPYYVRKIPSKCMQCWHGSCGFSFLYIPRVATNWKPVPHNVGGSHCMYMIPKVALPYASTNITTNKASLIFSPLSIYLFNKHVSPYWHRVRFYSPYTAS